MKVNVIAPAKGAVLSRQFPSLGRSSVVEGAYMHTFGLTSESKEVSVDVRMHVHVESVRMLTTNKLWKVGVLPTKAEQVADLLLTPAEAGAVPNVSRLKVHELLRHDRRICLELCELEGKKEDGPIFSRRHARAQFEAGIRR